MNTPALPLIDMAPLAGGDEAARRQVAAQVGAACREIGFFAITGHGVPQATIDDAFAASAEFFGQPLAAKLPLAYATVGHNRGYVGMGVEALDETKAGDQKEAFNLIWTDERTRPPNVWPELPGWQARLQAYFDAVYAAARRLHGAFALDLGLPEDFFADKIDRPLATLRLLHYPAGLNAPDSVGAGAHTDYGNVTLLATNGVSGLQVQGRARDQWIDVPPLPGAFVCNIGDCLMRWTNDVYLSTPHRVLRPTAERYSIAFFLDPNPDALVSAIPSCVPTGEAPRHAPISAADYVQSRLDVTYGAAKWAKGRPPEV